MGFPATPPGDASVPGSRWSSDLELVIRVAIIAERGCTTGLDVSELRRLSGYRDSVTPDQIAALRETDPLLGLVYMICDAERTHSAWGVIRRHQETLRSTVDHALEDKGFRPVFLISR